eukprot:12620820-Ditylum_brightwellii.AAC.1
MSFNGLSVNFNLVDRGKASSSFSVNRISGWSNAVVVLRYHLATVNGVSGAFFRVVESVISSTSSLKQVRLGDDLVASGAILVLSLDLDLLQ